MGQGGSVQFIIPQPQGRLCFGGYPSAL